MAISASQIVSVVPRILSGTGQDLVFNGLVLDTNERLLSNAPNAFTNADAVGAFFGTTSDEYQFASVYFGGFTNSQMKPTALYFYRYSANGAKAFLKGAKVDLNKTLANVKVINDGSLNIVVDGANVALDSLDFSNVTSFSSVADVLQVALRATNNEALKECSVSFDSLQNTFVITLGLVGSEHSISVAEGDVAEALYLTSKSGAVVSVGTDAQTLTEALNTCTGLFQNFVSFTTLWEAEDDEAIELSQWATTSANNGVMYLYVLWDSDANNLNATVNTTISDKLKALDVTATTIVYPDYKVASFVMGTGASINWDATNGTITFAFKAQSGLGASINNTDDHATLLNRGVNFIGNYATRNDNFVFFYNGSMLGDWAWIDTYLNATWLCNALQTQIMAGFNSVRKVSYTEPGYAIIRSWCRDVITRAINNAVIEAGVNISNTQLTALIQDLGGDYSQEIYNNGYYLQILDATATIRQNRQSPTCNLVYTYGGAVHRLNLPVVAVV